jgi:hypothetical protein
MFDLNQSVREWRQQMLAAGIKAPVPMEELENHLRDDIEQRIRSGVDSHRAFQMSVQQIGEARSLKTEFERVANNERKLMKRGLIIGAGIIGVLVGMAFVMPAVAQYQHEGAMKNEEPWLFLLGVLLTLAGLAAAIRSLRRSRA